ncbi:MAG: tRNA (adenosine(37)-N6)-threonylcarbamoyltransferase complex ATPase subunit type 1 TsaE [Bacteroidia bacterium]|nr:tRNA (adenosine(37)-N6)-threonylcarbamoyltransferase complex ATPase subunit type 1 TsaE [Bacteroidia bacterium]
MTALRLTYDLLTVYKAAEFIILNAGSYKLWCFYGEMGAGKTTLIKEIAKQLGVADAVSSPTFSLVNEYNSSSEKKLFHFDFYRVKNIEEVYDIGYEEYFYSNNFCLIEWPENIEEILQSEPYYSIQITQVAEGRNLLVEFK